MTLRVIRDIACSYFESPHYLPAYTRLHASMNKTQINYHPNDFYLPGRAHLGRKRIRPHSCLDSRAIIGGHHKRMSGKAPDNGLRSLLYFYAEGAFNKLYLVQTRQRQLLMRISLPVYPHSKTMGEVTTLRFFVEKQTCLFQK